VIRKEINLQKPGETARKILSAARALFAENGYNATHVDEIARRAGVNKATIYYQIGDKDTLYAHVIHQVIGNIAQIVAAAVAEKSDPEEKLAAYINNMADAVDKNPEIPPHHDARDSIRRRAPAARGCGRHIFDPGYFDRHPGGRKEKRRVCGDSSIPDSYDDHGDDPFL